MDAEDRPTLPGDRIDTFPSGLTRELTAAERIRATAMQIRAVMAGARWVLLGSLAGLWSMTASVWKLGISSTRDVSMWSWIAAGAGHLLGIWQTIAFCRTPHPNAAVIEKRRTLMFIAVYFGLFWGAMSWILLPDAPNPDVSTVVFIGVAGVILMGSNSFAIYRPAMLAFLVTFETVFVVGLLVYGEYMAVGYVLVLGGMAAGIGKTQNDAVKAAIYTGFETEKLLVAITEQQHAAENARKDAEHARLRAELANQGKTTFLAAAGHDLRQPMHALVQYFGQLKRKSRDPALSETIARIGKSLDAMQDLLDTILEVSKLMTGTVKPTITVFKVSDMFDRIDVQMRPIAEDKHLGFEISSIDCNLHTDEVLLERILRNITLNAIRYTNDGGIHVRAKRRGAKVVLQVFDTGIGIPADQREVIFEAFYQVGNEARNRRKGLGLGLAIVRQLCDLLGISVHLRSKEGKGSIFSVTLPIVQPARSVESPANPSSPWTRDFVTGAFVVLIDDNVPDLEATAATLAEFGCRVLTATSGLDAMERLQHQEFMPHLVISDYRLEGETGLDAIRMVIDNQRALFGDDFVIPALVLSGDTAPAELEKVQRAGYTMIHKPVGFDALYAVVNRELETLAHNGTGA